MRAIATAGHIARSIRSRHKHRMGCSMTDRIVWLTRPRPNSARPEGMTSEAYGEATDRTANAADGWIQFVLRRAAVDSAALSRPRP